MTVFICLADDNGLRFFGKRLSRDREITADILNESGGHIGMLSESQVLFDGKGSVYESIPQSECTFTERNIDFTVFDKIVIYRFNRKYPFDEALNIDLSSYRKESETEFQGYSHEKITKEIWVR